MTFTKDDYLGESWSDYESGEWEERILQDVIDRNDDGFSVLLCNEDGQPVTALRTMELDPVLRLLVSADYYRAFVHCRAATTHHVALDACHGWHEGEVYYFHNGFVPEGNDLKVDSLQIGKWLSIDVPYALERLYGVEYANVFLVDTKAGVYHVHRSLVNSLYTDGLGNYSTEPVGTCREYVEQWTSTEHELAEWRYTYEEKAND